MAYISFEPSDHFNTVLYTGNATDDRNITGVGFQPDWIWIKERSGGASASSHQLINSSRGSSLALLSNSTGAEDTDANRVQSFLSDGFQIGTASTVNENSQTYVAWNWNLNNGTTVSNTDGTITSTAQVNTTAGMSILVYTGTGSAGATIGHGLGATPQVIWVKRTGAAEAWSVYHEKDGGGETGIIPISGNAAFATSSGDWNNTAPGSSTFTVGTQDRTNSSGQTHVAFCFTEINGFSRYGSYVGNGSADGPFIHCGFKPQLVIIKNRDAVENWYMHDSKRDSVNPNNNAINTDLSNAENENSAYDIDLLSNGFKIRNTNTQHNSSGYNYIFMAWADQSIVAASGLPNTAT